MSLAAPSLRSEIMVKILSSCRALVESILNVQEFIFKDSISHTIAYHFSPWMPLFIMILLANAVRGSYNRQLTRGCGQEPKPE